MSPTTPFQFPCVWSEILCEFSPDRCSSPGCPHTISAHAFQLKACLSGHNGEERPRHSAYRFPFRLHTNGSPSGSVPEREKYPFLPNCPESPLLSDTTPYLCNILPVEAKRHLDISSLTVFGIRRFKEIGRIYNTACPISPHGNIFPKPLEAIDPGSSITRLQSILSVENVHEPDRSILSVC